MTNVEAALQILTESGTDLSWQQIYERVKAKGLDVPSNSAEPERVFRDCLYAAAQGGKLTRTNIGRSSVFGLPDATKSAASDKPKDVKKLTKLLDSLDEKGMLKSGGKEAILEIVQKYVAEPASEYPDDDDSVVLDLTVSSDKATA